MVLYCTRWLLSTKNQLLEDTVLSLFQLHGPKLPQIEPLIGRLIERLIDSIIIYCCTRWVQHRSTSLFIYLCYYFLKKNQFTVDKC